MIHGILAGLLAGAFWGFSFLTPKILFNFLPIEISLGRYFFFALASFIFILFNIKHLKGWQTFKSHLMAFFLSLCGYSVYYVLLTTSVQKSGITVSSLIIGLLPLTIALASREKANFKIRFRFSLLLIFVGIMLLNLDFFTANFWMEGKDYFWGVILAFIALIVWTAFAVINSSYLKKNPKISSRGWASLLGIYSFITMTLIIFILDPDFSLQNLVIRENFYLYIGWMVLAGLGSSWLATWLWNIASSRLPTSLTGQLIVSETVFALLYGFIYHKSLPQGLEAFSILILISGVWLGASSFKKS